MVFYVHIKIVYVEDHRLVFHKKIDLTDSIETNKIHKHNTVHDTLISNFEFLK